MLINSQPIEVSCDKGVTIISSDRKVSSPSASRAFIEAVRH
jgi:hypothetical protein